MLEYEHQAWSKGITRLAGVDEAGRGPLAGPVVAAAVVIDREYLMAEQNGRLRELTDSKKLTPARREAFFELFEGEREVEFATGIVDAAEIDRINILQATHRAMVEALQGLASRPDMALVDGRPVPGLGFESEAIVKGDQKSFLIAAASVVAKVSRDRMMEQFDSLYPQYGFARHKGYGSRSHFVALMEHGPSPIHRQSFRPVQESARLHDWSMRNN